MEGENNNGGSVVVEPSSTVLTATESTSAAINANADIPSNPIDTSASDQDAAAPGEETKLAVVRSEEITQAEQTESFSDPIEHPDSPTGVVSAEKDSSGQSLVEKPAEIAEAVVAPTVSPAERPAEEAGQQQQQVQSPPVVASQLPAEEPKAAAPKEEPKASAKSKRKPPNIPVSTSVHFGPESTIVTCASCQNPVATTVEPVSGRAFIVGMVVSAVLVPVFGIGCIPGCILLACKPAHDVLHKCPRCMTQLGRWTRL